MSDVIVRVEHVSKKFCRNLRRSLWYGVRDLSSELIGRPRNHNILRQDEFWAVDDVSFELRRGECLGLIGHNGAGKTTLLRMLNGLITPDRGRIEMHGRVGALIALGAGFNPVLSGRENIYVNAAVLGFSKRETDGCFDEIVAFSGLEEFIDAPVQQYSSGMYVRLGFSIAAHLEPDVLLVDEALAVGDIAFVFKCLNRIAELRKKGTAIIFVTHNQVQLREAAQRCILLERGHMLINSTVEDALTAHDNSPAIREESWASDAGYVHAGKIAIKRCLLTPIKPSTGDKIRIELELEVTSKIASALFELRFWNATGQLITTIRPNGREYSFDPSIAMERIVVEIPRLTLAPGVYRLAGGFRHDGEVMGWSRDIANITVQAPSDQWLGAGIVPLQAHIYLDRPVEPTR